MKFSWIKKLTFQEIEDGAIIPWWLGNAFSSPRKASVFFVIVPFNFIVRGAHSLWCWYLWKKNRSFSKWVPLKWAEDSSYDAYRLGRTIGENTIKQKVKRHLGNLPDWLEE